MKRLRKQACSALFFSPQSDPVAPLVLKRVILCSLHPFFDLVYVYICPIGLIMPALGLLWD